MATNLHLVAAEVRALLKRRRIPQARARLKEALEENPIIPISCCSPPGGLHGQ